MSPKTEEQARCQSCGGPLAPGAAFCRGCGARRDSPPPTQESAPTSQAPPPPQFSPAPSKGWTKPILLAALAGLLVGGAIAATIVLLGGDDSKGPSSSSAGGVATVPAGEVPAGHSGEASSSEEASGFPTEDKARMASEIQATLLSFHEDVVAERFRDAWSLQSARKRAQYLREQGYQKWMANQETLAPYLSPGGLTVRVDGLEDEGVARVLLSGMGWSEPGSPCSEWSGLTWVKYEGGEWTYDPGYSTTSERERVWKPRLAELLGANC